MRRAGIGLSEWLAGIGVVLLVGAVALPVALKNREASTRVACMRNLKQIGAAVLLYAADADDVLPSTTERKPRLGFGLHWSRTVQPYIASLDAFVCPGDPQPARSTYKDRTIEGQVPRISYVNNYAAIPAHDFHPVPRSTFTAPDRLILIAERRVKTYLIGRLPAWKGTSGFFPGQPCADQPFGAKYGRVTPEQAVKGLAEATRDDRLLLIRTNWTMHGEGSNYTFADGHAAFESLGRTLAPTDYQWGERFYPRSRPGADCDGHPRRKTPAYPLPL